jgi:hypothetical protein
MATQPKSMQAISMEYLLRLPQTIWATDDTTDLRKYTTGDDLALDVLREIFAKIEEYHRKGGTVKLMIQDQRYIVRDPSFTLPGTATAAKPAPTKPRKKASSTGTSRAKPGKSAKPKGKSAPRRSKKAAR